MHIRDHVSVLTDEEMLALHPNSVGKSGYDLLSEEAVQRTMDAVEAKVAKAEAAIDELGEGAFIEALWRRGFAMSAEED